MIKRAISIAAAALTLSSVSVAQPFFDYFSELMPSPKEEQKTEKAIEFDYDLDFEYYTDIRDFNKSGNLFKTSDNINRARISPAFGIKSRPNTSTTHRLLLGVNLTKELGANPTLFKNYSSDESDNSQINSKLFKEIFYYYNFQTRLGTGLFNLFAGIYPRNEMGGEYGMALFSEDVLMSDPNIEGLLLKYRTPRLFAEAGGDWSGAKGLDRYERYTIFSAGAFSFIDWLSAGWAATYMNVGNSLIFPCSFSNITASPYIKTDFSGKSGLQELSLKASYLASAQINRDIESSPHMPMGCEGIFRIKNWNIGVEDTFFYGDNMMPYLSASYSNGLYRSQYIDLLYLGDPFYFTRRGFASGYNRVELFYEPEISNALSLKASAIGHFLLPPTEAFGSFAGWQFKFSVIFNLDGLRIRDDANSHASKSGKKERDGNGSKHAGSLPFKGI